MGRPVEEMSKEELIKALEQMSYLYKQSLDDNYKTLNELPHLQQTNKSKK